MVADEPDEKDREVSEQLSGLVSALVPVDRVLWNTERGLLADRLSLSLDTRSSTIASAVAKELVRMEVQTMQS